MGAPEVIDQYLEASKHEHGRRGMVDGGAKKRTKAEIEICITQAYSFMVRLRLSLHILSSVKRRRSFRESAADGQQKSMPRCCK